MTVEKLESGDFGVSWTLSKELAEYFVFTYVRNFSSEGKPKVVHQIEVMNVETLAYFNQRGEHDVIYVRQTFLAIVFIGKKPHGELIFYLLTRFSFKSIRVFSDILWLTNRNQQHLSRFLQLCNYIEIQLVS